MSPIDARLLAYVSVTFVFAVTPGATTAVVVRSALAHGRRAGLVTATGAAAGNASQATAAGVGLAVLVHQWPAAFAALRIAGALYLASLGAKSLWRVLAFRSAAAPHQRSPAIRTGSHFRQGLLANLLNPSVGTFYLAVLPTFLTSAGTPAPFAALAAIHISIAFACHACWATAFDRLRSWLARPVFWRTLEAATGLALLALAWKTLR
jgi:threonine/homoserine/homoserine lactone efflux protein